MSKYTTEVRFICETSADLEESVGYTSIDDVLDLAIPKVFDFSFPIFDENYRNILEKKILKHYYTREIGEETVGLWKLRLDTKLNEIMPYYNKLYESELLEFNPLYTYNLTKTGNKNTDENIQDDSTSVGSLNTSSKGNTKSTNTTEFSGDTGGTNRDVYSDTPQGGLTNLENNTYLTNARKVVSEGTSNSTTGVLGELDTSESSNSNSADTTNYKRTRGNLDTYLEEIVGFNGTSASKLLQDYRETFLNIDMMIINELEPLFFGLW